MTTTAETRRILPGQPAQQPSGAKPFANPDRPLGRTRAATAETRRILPGQPAQQPSGAQPFADLARTHAATGSRHTLPDRPAQLPSTAQPFANPDRPLGHARPQPVPAGGGTT
ncbi:hypothetical protein GCM10009759_77520 [Kitasatospora saccharophila]|uniref:Uncharacterized protein n=1 Tax=Kitasatospora saccharophila TaxID=407973 RepID=A0ABN2YCP5_9ACTN